MKKTYKKPNIDLFPTKCHVSSLSPDEPEEINGSRRNLIARVGLMATVGHLSLLHASGGDDGGPTSSVANPWSTDKQ